jgi:hypothetical protein
MTHTAARGVADIGTGYIPDTSQVHCHCGYVIWEMEGIACFGHKLSFGHNRIINSLTVCLKDPTPLTSNPVI